MASYLRKKKFKLTFIQNLHLHEFNSNNLQEMLWFEPKLMRHILHEVDSDFVSHVVVSVVIDLVNRLVDSLDVSLDFFDLLNLNFFFKRSKMDNYLASWSLWSWSNDQKLLIKYLIKFWR